VTEAINDGPGAGEPKRPRGEGGVGQISGPRPDTGAPVGRALRGGDLPITPLLPAVLSALETARSAVVIAPPGAGKTTEIPLALLGAPWLPGPRILLLEPRRLAARNAAGWMARRLGEPGPGGTVGYRMRQESRIGPRTRIEVVTEGILTRMIQDDPTLAGVGAVLFDEIHERSLDAELGLALTLEARSLFAPELRVLLLSATLDPEPVVACLREHPDNPLPVLVSEGRSFPVETRWITPERRARFMGRSGVERGVAQVVVETLPETEGDVLVFLPGAREIHWVRAELTDRRLPGVQVVILHGSLSRAAQDLALSPAPPGVRKVILSSAVAETSLTLEGVRVVVDGGLMRVPRFDPGSGLTRLVTVQVTRDAADQRRGRAGRTAPGWCVRVWTEGEDRGLVPARRPEILDADLAPLLMEVARFGVEPEALRWLTPPPGPALVRARELLDSLRILTPEGNLTPEGQTLATFGTHPRLARLLRAAETLAVGELGASLASLLEDRDLFVRDQGRMPEADLRLRLEALATGRAPLPGIQLDRGSLDRIRMQAATFRRRARGRGPGLQAVPSLVQHSTPHPSPVCGSPAKEGDEFDTLGLAVAEGWPDRIAQLRSGGRYKLANGRGATLEPGDSLWGTPVLVAVEVEERGGDGRILRAIPLDLAAYEARFPEAFREEPVVRWIRDGARVEAVRIRSLGSLEVAREPIPHPPSEWVSGALAEGIRLEGIGALPWTSEALQLRNRIRFMALHDPEGGWAEMSDEGLLGSLEFWLLPHAPGVRSLEGLRKGVNLTEALLTGVPWEARVRLDQWAPTGLVVPSGSRVTLRYEDPEAPVLAVRLQELFGMLETPRLAGGRVPLMVHLLSPAGRPVQVTRDLAGFWRDTYFDVRKDLRGRYPKHYWPDDPLSAPATRRPRPRDGE